LKKLNKNYVRDRRYSGACDQARDRFAIVKGIRITYTWTSARLLDYSCSKSMHTCTLGWLMCARQEGSHVVDVARRQR